MIFQIKGKLILKNGLLIIVDVVGVGYGLFASMNTLSRLPSIGEDVLLYTHLIVREDAHILYGFLEEKEKLLFCELIKISGFGPKLALSILSHLTVEQFLNVIMLKEISKLTDLPGIGSKIAQRVMIEMGNKIDNKKFMDLLGSNLKFTVDSKNFFPDHIISDTQEALRSLGYTNKEAITAIRKVVNEHQDSSTITSNEQLLKAVLKNLSKVYYD